MRTETWAPSACDVNGLRNRRNHFVATTREHLEAKLADKCTEVDFLKSQLAVFRADRFRGAEKCARCGLLESGTEIAILGDDATDAPVFPNELLLLIATHLESETRSLLNLARSCRGSLYELLLPRLYESFSVGRIYEKVKMTTRCSSKTLSVPYGLAHVEELHATIWLNDLVSNSLHLVVACKSIVKLECDLMVFHRLVHYEKTEFLRLETLDIHMEDVDRTFENFAAARERAEYCNHDGMPNIRTLILKGEPCIELIWLLEHSCPLLSDVTLMCGDSEFEVTMMPESFVPKIRKLDFFELRILTDIVEHFPYFAPETIICDDDQLDEEDWRLFCRLPSLKRLELSRLYSWLILPLRFPPNLEFLSVSHFEPALYWNESPDFDARPKKLGELTALAQLRFELINEIYSPPFFTEESDVELRQVAAELRFWKSVPGFSIKGKAENIDALEQQMRGFEM